MAVGKARKSPYTDSMASWNFLLCLPAFGFQGEIFHAIRDSVVICLTRLKICLKNDLVPQVAVFSRILKDGLFLETQEGGYFSKSG